MLVSCRSLSADHLQGCIRAAARVADVALLGLHPIMGRRAAFRFRLIPTSTRPYPWQRFSSSPFATKAGNRRRVHAVCWHGQRAFMRALYARVPEARIATALTTYTSAEHFETTHNATANHQTGPMIARVSFAELCQHGYGRAAGKDR